MSTKAQLKTDLDDIRLAQKKIIKGERVGEVTYQGRKVSYVEVTLPQLAEEEKRLGRLLAQYTRHRYSIMRTTKGF